jgi:hypothetical protein
MRPRGQAARRGNSPEIQPEIQYSALLVVIWSQFAILGYIISRPGLGPRPTAALTINDLFFRLRHDEREIGADRADRPIDIANTGGTRQMNKHIRDNVIFVFVATAAFLSEPTIANAQTDPYNPVNFTEPLSCATS